MRVWAISSEDEDMLWGFREAFGLELPILVDPGAQVHEQYRQESAFPTAAFPQEWVVGADGTLVFESNVFDYEAITTVLDQELAR